MKKSRADRLAKYGVKGVAFLEVMRPRLAVEGVVGTITQALCNYMYREILAEEWVLKPLVALEYLREKCPKPGRYEFRRANLKQPFGPNNCVVVHITE